MAFGRSNGKTMSKDVNEILKEATEHVKDELSRQDIPDKRLETFTHARMSRHLRLAENNAAREYYKKHGRHFDNHDNDSTTYNLFIRVLLFILYAFLTNLVLYFPTYYLAVHWGEVNKHDATYAAIIVNTAIGMIAGGIWSEHGTKRTAFIAGMRAEADKHVVGNYHEAKGRIEAHNVSKGNLPDYDFEWDA